MSLQGVFLASSEGFFTPERVFSDLRGFFDLFRGFSQSQACREADGTSGGFFRPRLNGCQRGFSTSSSLAGYLLAAGWLAVAGAGWQLWLAPGGENTIHHKRDRYQGFKTSRHWTGRSARTAGCHSDPRSLVAPPGCFSRLPLRSFLSSCLFSYHMHTLERTEAVGQQLITQHDWTHEWLSNKKQPGGSSLPGG